MNGLPTHVTNDGRRGAARNIDGYMLCQRREDGSWEVVSLSATRDQCEAWMGGVGNYHFCPRTSDYAEPAEHHAPIPYTLQSKNDQHRAVPNGGMYDLLEWCAEEQEYVTIRRKVDEDVAKSWVKSIGFPTQDIMGPRSEPTHVHLDFVDILSKLQEAT